MTSTPHDALFKSTFTDRDNAIAELRAVLPRALSERLDFATLEVETGGYVDPELGARFSDLVYRVTVGGVPIRIYVLFEHQSRPDPDMAFRLLRYMVRLWEHLAKVEPKLSRPPIVPIVLTHGERGWKVSRSFLDTLALGEDASVRAAIEPYVPRFEYLLDDLSGLSDREIAERAASAWLRMVLLLLRDGRGGRVPRLLGAHRDLLQAVFRGWPVEVFAQLMSYAGHVTDESERDELVAVFKSLGPGPEEQAMRSVAELFRDEARAEAEAKGEAKGRAEGLRATLRKQMKLKFGSVSDVVSGRIDAASIEELDRWVERILVATSAEDVIAG